MRRCRELTLTSLGDHKRNHYSGNESKVIEMVLMGLQLPHKVSILAILEEVPASDLDFKPL